MKRNLFNPRAYHAIRLWGQRLGSAEYFIREEQERAADACAPVDAIYRSSVAGTLGEWRTIRDLHPEHPIRAAYDAWHVQSMAIGATVQRVANSIHHGERNERQ